MPIGHGSLHNNLTHIVGAMRRWNDRIAGGVLRPSIELPPEAKERTPGRLIELLEEANTELSATLHAAIPDLSRRVLFTYPATDGDRTINLTAGAAFCHLYTHGQHHRSQCLNMLRQLGYPTDSGDFDVIEWSDAAAKPGA